MAALRLGKRGLAPPPGAVSWLSGVRPPRKVVGLIRMKTRRILLIVVAAAAVIGLAGGLAKDAIVRRLIVRALASAGGFDVSIDSLHVGLIRSTLELRGVKILNPTNFPVREAAEINRIFIRYDRFGLFQGGSRIPELDLDLARIVMIRNGDGQMNLDRLAGGMRQSPPAVAAAEQPRVAAAGAPSAAPPVAAAPPPSPPRATAGLRPEWPPVRIDSLRLRLGKLDYYDYGLGSEPMVLPVEMNLDETFVNVTNAMDIADQLAARLPLAGLGRLPAMDRGGEAHREKTDRAIESQIERVVEGL